MKPSLCCQDPAAAASTLCYCYTRNVLFASIRCYCNEAV